MRVLSQDTSITPLYWTHGKKQTDYGFQRQFDHAVEINFFLAKWRHYFGGAL